MEAVCLHLLILRFRIPPPPALRDCYIPDDMHDVKCCVHYCYTIFASTTYDVEILIVLQFYLLQKNAHNLQVRSTGAVKN